MLHELGEDGTVTARADSPSEQHSRLSRELIITTALAQIDANGASSLSMRSLAQELGVEAMSLYRHVHGKEDLLEGVVALLMDELLTDLDGDLAAHWQGYLQTAAHEIRRIAVEHPKVFPLVATRHPAAPWLRPPLRSVEVVNAFLSALINHGFTDQQAVDTYRSFSSFLLGQLLLEAAVRGAEIGPVDQVLDEGSADIPSRDGRAIVAEAPEVFRLRNMLSEDRSEEEFEVSLEALLDRLAHQYAQ
jgi:AcrR family transcriptional regulator